MAIQLSLKSRYGMRLSQAYARVNAINLKFEGGRSYAEVSIAFFANKKAADADLEELHAIGLQVSEEDFQQFFTELQPDARANVYAWLQQRIPQAGEPDFRTSIKV